MKKINFWKRSIAPRTKKLFDLQFYARTTGLVWVIRASGKVQTVFDDFRRSDYPNTPLYRFRFLVSFFCTKALSVDYFFAF